jgi:hypothetical protein
MLARCLLFQHLERNRQGRPARLPDKQMNVLRHQNIPGNYKSLARTSRLKLPLEDAVGSLPHQQRACEND